MDNLWRIVANASQVVNDWERSWQFPTFYVHASSEEEAAENLLSKRLPFKGNSMRAIIPEGEDRDGDYVSHMGKLYLGAGKEFTGRKFQYLVFSYSTPIAGVCEDGEVVIPEMHYSSTTSRHQGLCRRFLHESPV